MKFGRGSLLHECRITRDEIVFKLSLSNAGCCTSALHFAVDKSPAVKTFYTIFNLACMFENSLVLFYSCLLCVCLISVGSKSLRLSVYLAQKCHQVTNFHLANLGTLSGINYLINSQR